MTVRMAMIVGTVARVETAFAAQAADLPSKAAAPVEYVRVCSQFGSGFFYVPGSDTCIKLAGRVRADYIFTEPFSRQTNTTTFRGRGYLALDSYTPTDYGALRATLRAYVTKNSGSDASRSLEWAHIQWARMPARPRQSSLLAFSPTRDHC